MERTDIWDSPPISLTSSELRVRHMCCVCVLFCMHDSESVKCLHDIVSVMRVECLHERVSVLQYEYSPVAVLLI